MLRSWLIVIFSLVCWSSTVCGSTVKELGTHTDGRTWRIEINGGFVLCTLVSGPSFIYPTWAVDFADPSTGVMNQIRTANLSYSTSTVPRTISFTVGTTDGFYRIRSPNYPFFGEHYIQRVNGVSTFTSLPDPGEETRNFDITFPEKYEGGTFQLKRPDGSVFATYGLPADIPPEGYVLPVEISGTAEELDSLIAYLNGVSIPELVGMEPIDRDASEFSVDQGNYSFEFDDSYQDGEWKIVRPDGSIAASGSSTTLGSVLNGSVTIAEGENAEVYVRVPAGDGNGSVWVPSGVAVPSGGSTTYAFIGAPEKMDVPAVPSQSPMPSPVPVPSPSPDPLPLPSPSPFVPGPGADETTVDDTTIDWPIPDDDLEEQIEEQNRTLLEAFGESFSNINAIGNSFTQGMNMFSGTTLGGVGRDCTLMMGNTAIQLNVPTAVRTGTAVVAYIISLITVVSLVSRMFNAS